MDLELENRVVVITGAGSGMGRAGALVFAGEGAQVVVADVDDAGGQATVAQIRAGGGDALYQHCDVSNAAQTMALAAAAVARFGRIDVLYNNAAATTLCNRDDRPCHELPEAIWDRQHAVTLKGVYLCAKACLPVMIQQGGGMVLNVSSIDATLAEAGFDSYTAAKGGVEALTRSMAAYYGKHHIRVVCLRPAYVMTEVQDWVANDPEARRRIEALHLTPLGRPEDVAHVAAFVASNKARFITGTVIDVDGGYGAFKHTGAELSSRVESSE